MRKISFLVLSLVLIALCPRLLSAQTSALPADKPGPPRKRGGIFTIYAVDPLARTLCFSDGKEGMALVNNKLENRCSDLSYTLAGGGSLRQGDAITTVAPSPTPRCTSGS